MHVLGQYGKENAAAIFQLFIETMPTYPIDQPDMEGNTGKTPPPQESRMDPLKMQ